MGMEKPPDDPGAFIPSSEHVVALIGPNGKVIDLRDTPRVDAAEELVQGVFMQWRNYGRDEIKESDNTEEVLRALVRRELY